MTVNTAPAPAVTSWLVPAHPVLGGHPAPLSCGYLDTEDPRWLEGPWKTMAKYARDAGWTVKLYAARGYTITSTGNVGALLDTMSLRCWRPPATDVRNRVVALWQRHTWPTLGRGRKEDDGRQGEGRATTDGKTWLWHPPMVPPDLVRSANAKDVDPLVTKWTFSGGWLWSIVQPMISASSAEVRAHLKNHGR